VETSSHVKEIRQCNCEMCQMIRSRGKSFSKWGSIRQSYRVMFADILKGGDPDNYNKKMATRDYDA
jgi:hypothetical protein